MKTWTDLGNGRRKLVITDDDGAILSMFRGTNDEILDKLADSQANANKRINELRGAAPGLNGQPNAPSQGTRPMTPEERLNVVAEMGSPATVDKAVTRVLESVVGPVDQLRRNSQEDAQERQVRAATVAAESFFESTPEWHPSDHNKITLTKYVFAQRLDPTKAESYTQAFEALSAAQLLQPKPEESETTIEEPPAEGRNAPVTPTPPRTPTRSSTSIRSSDLSGRRPEPSGQPPRMKYTREQLNNLSAEDYKRLMQTDRKELERCEAYYANPRGQARAS